MNTRLVKRLESLGVYVYDSSGEYRLRDEARRFLVGVSLFAGSILALWLFFDFLVPYIGRKFYGW